ncbi:cobalamin binding intrinsic factor-like [Mercenaria mercenaria]|uniref:cobalamin binding intrinsic factor-like n=1 Tax=Mercenaria mercenaria TaxID=6596 RepID=UPI00234E7017|nr:cobalamin binding intrinsic factor-like [Mercenaria mercenaria]
MDTKLLVIVLCLMVTVSWTQDDQCKEGKRCRKFFQYTINNQLQKPYFRSSINLRVYPFVRMIRYMEEAVLINPEGFINFRANFTSPYGYYVDTIHLLTEAYKVNKTYWQISNSSGPLDVGVSSYKPVPGDKILFNFTQGGHCGRN